MSTIQPRHMLPVDMQLANEYQYNRKHIDGYLRAAIAENPETDAKVHQGVALLQDWLSQEYYDSKNARLAQVKTLDLEELVREIFVGICYCQVETLFTSITAQLAGRLKFSEKIDGIQTIAEMLAVLCQTDAFDINKLSQNSSLMVLSQIPLSDQLRVFVDNTAFLPPMVCEPRTLTHNYQSGYLTHDDSVILGSGNHHDGDVCLDVLNIQNSVRLTLDKDFLLNVEEQPTFDLEVVKNATNKDGSRKTKQQQLDEIRRVKDQWHAFKGQSSRFYLMLYKQGNRFWLTHKVDKRGRIYSVGYHITTQGTSFKKAMIEFADAEVVSGVPDFAKR